MTDAFELADNLKKASEELREQALRDLASKITLTAETLQGFAFSFAFQYINRLHTNIQLYPRTPAATQWLDTFRTAREKAGRDPLEFLDLPPAMKKFYFGVDKHIHWTGSLDDLEKMLVHVGPVDILDREEVIKVISAEHERKQKAADEAKAALDQVARLPLVHVWEGGRP